MTDKHKCFPGIHIPLHEKYVASALEQGVIVRGHRTPCGECGKILSGLEYAYCSECEADLGKCQCEDPKWKREP